MASAASFYAPDKVRNRFAVRGQFYGVAGHRGQDFAAARGAPIPAYEHGIVVYNPPWSRYIGWCTVIRLDDGKYAGWAHLIGGTRLPVGTEVWRDTTIGAVAGAADDPGSSWDGAHVHTTLGANEESIFSGVVYDPLPRIQLSGASPASATPVSPIRFEEADMAYPVRNRDTGGIYVVAPRFIKHFNAGEDWVTVRNVLTVTDEVHELSADQFTAVLDGLGIPRDRVPDGGRIWSPDLEIASAIAELKAG